MATVDPPLHLSDIRQETKPIVSNDGTVYGLTTEQAGPFSENDANKENVAGSAESVDAISNDACLRDETQDNDGDDSPVIDININNVVCTFNVRCHINLKRVAMEGSNVEYRRQHGILNMKLRQPRVTANITSSGKVTVTGSTSEAQAKMAARRVARVLQKMGFNVRFRNFRVVNVLGTCSLPFGIKLNNFSNQFPQEASYEPELHPGVTFRIKQIKATLKIFSTGSITITAPCVANIGTAVEHIYPLVSEYQMEKREAPPCGALKHKRFHSSAAHRPINGHFQDDSEDEDEELYDSDLDDDSFDSDVSHD
ncbi:hypothetical protein BaRGS_00007202 [Batillaria attramentaria]|uniref:TATA box-binding protein-like 1 n=1 Tax=Batillaria attramentaria TaxID=370345 RepID=A0ABD0LPI8_9CAEN